MLFHLIRVAEAQEAGASLDSFMVRVYDVIINPLIVLVFAVALFLFLVGMLRFFFNKGQDSEASNKGKQHMLWGIIGMFIMVSVFAIMQIILNALGVDATVG